MSFQLTKWYFDCVSSEGAAFIGYWARLTWGSLHMRYAAALIAPPDGEVQRLSTIRGPAEPTRAAQLCEWQCEQIGVQGRWQACASPLDRLSLRTEHGQLRWSCFEPRARASVSIAAGHGVPPLAFEGLGYAERLDLSIPPWSLPFDTLYWGRFLSDQHALVWLECQDTRSPRKTRRRYANLDGHTEPRPRINNFAVKLPSLNAELTMLQSRPLRRGSLAQNVFNTTPALQRALPEKFRNAHESKALSAAQLRLADGTCANGWSIHEVVRW